MDEEVVPVLYVEDADRAVAWYGRLGYAKEWEHQFEPNFPWFVSVARGSVRLYLSEHKGDARPDTLIHLYVRDIDASRSTHDQVVRGCLSSGRGLFVRTVEQLVEGGTEGTLFLDRAGGLEAAADLEQPRSQFGITVEADSVECTASFERRSARFPEWARFAGAGCMLADSSRE